nr:YusW family protein [Geomicrobium sp. JCM 19039]
MFDETYEYQMNDQELSGEEAKPEIESFIFSLGLTQDLQDEQMKLKVLDKLQLSEKEVKEFTLDLTFDGGKSQTVK